MFCPSPSLPASPPVTARRGHTARTRQMLEARGQCECTGMTARGHLEASPHLKSYQLSVIPSPLSFVLGKSMVCWSWWEQHLAGYS